jgi:hypothetical protein
LFVLAALGFMVLAVTAEQIPGFPRYYSPLYPGMAVVTGVLVAVLARQRDLPRRLGAAVVVAGLGVGAAVTFQSVHDRAEGIRAATEDALPVQQLVGSIDDDRGVIGARAHQIVYGVRAGTPTWGDQYLTEEEYVTYLSWPSDEVVIDLLERHDIGWVVIHANRLLETTYNDVWLHPFHGVSARHVEAVAASPRFCRWYEGGSYLLFKLGPCPPDPAGEVVAGEPG